MEKRAMEKINSIISSYQHKICKHDRQFWEQSIEQELFIKLHTVPRKEAKINTSLIDVDLFRGSGFSLSKSPNGWLSIATVAWLRLVFFPFYYKWWLCTTCGLVFALLCALYIFQVGSLFICYMDFRQSQNAETLTMADFVSPYIMMYVLTLVHSLIAATYTSVPFRNSKLTSNSKRSKIFHVPSAQAQLYETIGKSEMRRSESAKDDLLKSFLNKPKKAFSNSYSLPLSDSSQKLLHSKFNDFPKTENWLEVESFPGTHQHPAQDVSVARNCQKLQLGAEPELGSFDLSGTEKSVYAGDNDLVAARSCAPATSGSAVTVVGSATSGSAVTIVGVTGEESTLCENIGHDADIEIVCDKRRSANTLQLPGEELKQQFKESAESESDAESGGRGSHLQRGDENEMDYQNSPLILSERGSEAASIADSNTSLSDTCNSSFVSSADEDIEGSIGDRDLLVNKPKQRDSEFICGIRQRRKQQFDSKLSGGSSSGQKSPSQRLETSSDMLGCSDKRKRADLEAEEAGSSDEGDSHLKPPCTKSRNQRQSATRKSGLSLQRRSDQLLDQKSSSGEVSDGRKRIGRPNDVEGSEKHTQSLPFIKSVMSSEFKDGTGKRSKAGQSNSERKLQASKNVTGNGAELASTGGQASLNNGMSSTTDKVSCMIWSAGGTVHKVDLTVLDIGWTVVRTVDRQQERCDYMMLGILLSFVIMCLPPVYRLYYSPDRENQICTFPNTTEPPGPSYTSLMFGRDIGQMAVLVNGMIQRLFLSLLFFFLLSVAERTFKQRLLYAKYFCYLTSSRKAKKYDLPHFRLNKVRNIKTWISLRSFLKKQGPQRSVESVVSTSFILAVILVSILCIELLQDYGHFLEHLGNWDLVLWSMILGIYLLRFITLGTKKEKSTDCDSALIPLLCVHG